MPELFFYIKGEIFWGIKWVKRRVLVKIAFLKFGEMLSKGDKEKGKQLQRGHYYISAILLAVRRPSTGLSAS